MNLLELKNMLEPEDIKRVLYEYGISPVQETETFLLYPTVCHNLEGGKNKLYYYFDSKMFVCYTECNDSFNIFKLVQKIEALRGYSFNVFEISEKMGYGTSPQRQMSEEDIKEEKEILFLKSLAKRAEAPIIAYEELNEDMLANFSYDPKYLVPWLEEGISLKAMERFQIGYSLKDHAISIPHRDYKGNLVGIRGRFLDPKSLNKYMPLSLNGKLLNHATRGSLYGLYENRRNIENLKRVIIFEGEKSVLHMETLFGTEGNIAVATCGNRITNEQIKLFSELKIEEAVLAFDKDYQTDVERQALLSKYDEMAKRLSIYFNTSIMIDWIGVTNYKDSPIDKGKEVFEELFESRYYV